MKYKEEKFLVYRDEGGSLISVVDYDLTPIYPVIKEINPKLEPDRGMIINTLKILEVEKLLIIEALRQTFNKRATAARLLGISERTLYRKILEYDIHVKLKLEFEKIN